MNDAARLVQDLRNSRDAETRREVIRALVEIGAPAVEPLKEALKARNEDVRRAAATALGILGDARAVLPLLEILAEKADTWRLTLLNEEDESLRAAAARALGKIGDARALPGLIAALKKAAFGLRRAAAEALRAIGDARAVPALLGALKDRDAAVREEAAAALALLITRKDAAAVPALLAALKDESRRVRAGDTGAGHARRRSRRPLSDPGAQGPGGVERAPRRRRGAVPDRPPPCDSGTTGGPADPAPPAARLALGR
jgi:HEAT repeat protein